MQKFTITILLLLILIPLFSQEQEELVLSDSIKDKEQFQIAIKPSKSAFYSAILPGLGQAYNKDYWKIPIVYGALGSGYYAYDFNNKSYIKYREAYKLLKLGQENDFPGISASSLERAQKYHKKYRDLSILVTAGLYMLQVVEASVDAHLQYHNTELDLTFKPIIFQDNFSGKIILGYGLTYNF